MGSIPDLLYVFSVEPERPSGAVREPVFQGQAYGAEGDVLPRNPRFLE